MNFKKTTHFTEADSHLPELSKKEKILELLALSIGLALLVASFMKVLFF